MALAGLVSLLGLGQLWAPGGWTLKQVTGWGYRVVYATPLRGTAEENPNRAAAVHYDLVCATCHGSPAEPQRGKQLRLAPPAPSLHLRAGKMPPEMMFQVIKSGIPNTAMPGWPALGRDDEIWIMVAFLENLPNMDANQYRALVHPVTLANLTPPLSTCLRCHGRNSVAPVTPSLPRIDFQSPAYISDSLHAYRRRARASGYMQSAASNLSDADIENLARHFGGEPLGREQSDAESADAPELVLTGSPSRQIPACVGCHGRMTPVRHDFPRLSGQTAEFLETQLRLFARRPQLRGGGPYSGLMREAARNLGEDDIKTLSQWYSDTRQFSANPDTWSLF
jgi:cytochrome c553